MSRDTAPADIRSLRSARGWTQQDLADELGTDAVTISRWERGVTHPRTGVRVRLARLIVETGPRGCATLVEDPTTRIRKLDSALRQMKELKRRLKPIG